jgi:hypothetical protein
MRVRVERSGGLLGAARAFEVDEAGLPPREALALRAAVERARFFDLPAALPASPGADRLRWRITVQDAGRAHTVEAGEDAPEVRALLAELRKHQA